MIESILTSVLKPIGSWIGRLFVEKVRPQKKEPESIADRFIWLFNSHGIARDQIPRFVPNLTLSNVNSSKKLIDALNDQIICDACDIFGVEREWLEGAQDEIYRHRSFYKNIRGLSTFFDEHKIGSENLGALYAVRKGGANFREAERNEHGAEIVLVFAKLVKQLSSEQVIFRYYPLHEGTSWGYPGSRMYIRAVCRLASDKSLMCRGIEVSKLDFEKLESLQAIPHKIIERSDGSWDIYRLVMTDDEIPESIHSTGGDWTDLIRHRDPV